MNEISWYMRITCTFYYWIIGVKNEIRYYIGIIKHFITEYLSVNKWTDEWINECIYGDGLKKYGGFQKAIDPSNSKADSSYHAMLTSNKLVKVQKQWNIMWYLTRQ